MGMASGLNCSLIKVNKSLSVGKFSWSSISPEDISTKSTRVRNITRGLTSLAEFANVIIRGNRKNRVESVFVDLVWTGIKRLLLWLNFLLMFILRFKALGQQHFVLFFSFLNLLQQGKRDSQVKTFSPQLLEILMMLYHDCEELSVTQHIVSLMWLHCLSFALCVCMHFPCCYMKSQRDVGDDTCDSLSVLCWLTLLADNPPHTLCGYTVIEICSNKHHPLPHMAALKLFNISFRHNTNLQQKQHCFVFPGL